MALEQTVKQRLIGAIVLVAIAVIFLPGILGQKKDKRTFVSEVPEKSFSQSTQDSDDISAPSTSFSDTSSRAIDTKQNNESVSNKRQADDSAKTPEAKQRSEGSTSQPDSVKKTVETNSSEGRLQNDVRPAVSSESTNSKPIEAKPVKELKQNSWVVQVGSFSSHANAELLSKRLEERKLKSFVRPVELDKEQILYRVFVGPWLQKAQAEKELENIADITRLKPIVVAWNPERQ